MQFLLQRGWGNANLEEEDIGDLAIVPLSYKAKQSKDKGTEE